LRVTRDREVLVEARRSALIVASDEYIDPKLRRLRAPARDAEALAHVLGDPDVGGFEVDVCLNEPEYKVRRKLSEFFANRTRDDLLLVHFSCHGLKDDDGNLYFATPDTELEHLDSSSVPSEFVNRQMHKSRSRRIALFLDCCYSGAFSRGGMARAGGGVELAERFEGQGQVVITASNSMEYAFEGDELTGEGTPSVFTTALVEGLESGAADRDGDDLISIDELYDYIFDRVRETTPDQTPSKWAYDLQGELYIAKNRNPRPVDSAELPIELREAMESPLARVRYGVVGELEHLLTSTNARLAAAARLALQALTEDDSRSVSEAAMVALSQPAQPQMVEIGSPKPVRAAEPVDRNTPPSSAPLTQEEPQAAQPRALRVTPVRGPGQRRVAHLPSWLRTRTTVSLVALVGASLLLLGAGSSPDFEGAVTLETTLITLAAAAAAIMIVGWPLSTSLASGLLLGFGAVVTASELERLSGAVEIAWLLSLLGAVATLCAAVLALTTLADPTAERIREPPRGRRQLSAVLAVVGAGLGTTALVVPIDSYYGFALIEPDQLDAFRGSGGLLLGVVGAIVVSVLLVREPSWRPLVLAGMLIAIGAQILLRFLTFAEILDTPRYLVIGLGLAGGFTIAASGILVYRTTRTAATRPAQ
jgi:hypothetical protein